MFFRTEAIAIEVLILMATIYSLFLAVRLTIIDVGIQSKYDQFIKRVLGIVGTIISAFFIAHLTLFYPKLLP